MQRRYTFLITFTVLYAFVFGCAKPITFTKIASRGALVNYRMDQIGDLYCGLQTDGKPLCWRYLSQDRGHNSFALDVLGYPKELKDMSYSDIYVGPDYACGVADDGTLKCWEYEPERGETKVADKKRYSNADAVAAFAPGMHTCLAAKNTPNKVSCTAIVTSPDPFAEYTFKSYTQDLGNSSIQSLALSDKYFCGSATDKTAGCFAKNISDAGPLRKVILTREFEVDVDVIKVGLASACAITPAKTVKCVGIKNDLSTVNIIIPSELQNLKINAIYYPAPPLKVHGNYSEPRIDILDPDPIHFLSEDGKLIYAEVSVSGANFVLITKTAPPLLSNVNVKEWAPGAGTGCAILSSGQLECYQLGEFSSKKLEVPML